LFTFHMKSCQDTIQAKGVNIKRLGIILVVLGAIAATVLALLVVQSYSVSPGKAMSPPPASASELEGGGVHRVNLDRFNLSNSSAPTKQEVMRVVRDWIEGNATQGEARLAIALWRNKSAATSGY
jgi:hypothetical protein